MAHPAVERVENPGARLEPPWRADYNALAYVLAGNGTALVSAQLWSTTASSWCSVPATRWRSPRTRTSPSA